MNNPEVRRRARMVMPVVIVLGLLFGFSTGFFNVPEVWTWLGEVLLLVPTVAWIVWPLRRARQ